MDPFISIWLVILTIAVIFTVADMISLSKLIDTLANLVKTHTEIITRLRLSDPEITLKALEPLREQLEEALKHWDPKK